MDATRAVECAARHGRNLASLRNQHADERDSYRDTLKRIMARFTDYRIVNRCRADSERSDIFVWWYDWRADHIAHYDRG